MFIVPNSLLSWRSEMWTEPLSKMEDRPTKSLSYKMRAEELRPFGIDTKLDDVFVQVWIHCEGSDNLSDHGFSEEQIKELFPNGDCRAVNDRVFAPGFLPVRLLVNKNEGDTITLTTVDGVDWKIRLDQRGYRYGHFGRFEKVLDDLIRKDNISSIRLARQASWLTEMGIRSEYKFGRIAGFLAAFKDMGFELKFDKNGTEYEYLDVVYDDEKVRVLRLDHQNSKVVTLQLNIAEKMYQPIGLMIAGAFSKIAA